MVLADDISALSASVQKLSDAVGKFVIARLSRGTFRVTPFSEWNTFDKLCNLMSSHMTMEQIAKFSLASKVILSYKIDFASSFYDQLAKGLWNKASNGCLYKLDDFERYLYVEINDHFEAYVQQSREKLQNFTVAHEVFDKMSEPTSTPSQESAYPNGVAMTKYTDGGQGSENGEVETSEKILTPKFCSNDEVEEGYRVTQEVFDVMQGIQIETSDVVEAENGQDDTQASVHQVFDELSQPILNSNALVLSAPDAIGELQEGSHEDVEQMMDCRIIDEGQALVVNVFGGEFVSKPIEDTIAQVADHIEDIASEYSGQSIYESSSIIVSEECHESLDHRRQMFAKLATLDDSLFQDLTFVLVCRRRFGTLNKVLLDVRQLSHQILQIEFVISAGNFRPDYELFPGDFVKVNLTSQGLNSRLSCNLVDNSDKELTPPIFIYDPGDTIHLILTSAIVFNSTTTILGVRTMTGDVQIFDPGISSVPLLFCCFTLEDKGVFRGEEEKVNVVYTRELCNVVVLGCKCMSSEYCVFGSCDGFGISSERCCTLGSLFLSCQLISLASLILAGFGMSGPIFQLIDSPYNILNGPWKSIERNQQKEKKLFAVTLLVNFSQQHFSCWPLICAETIEVGSICGFDVAAFCLTLNRSKVGKYHVLHCETAPYKSSGPQDIEALLRRLRVKRNEATNDDFFSVEEIECFDYSIDTTLMITIAQYFSELEGYTFNFCEDVTPKQDVMFWYMWPFDPGGKRFDVIRRGFAGVGSNGFFCVGIDGLNNIMLRTETSLSKLLKENLRVAIQSFRLLIVIYIFDPGGSMVTLFCTVIGIIACLIFDP